MLSRYHLRHMSKATWQAACLAVLVLFADVQATSAQTTVTNVTNHANGGLIRSVGTTDSGGATRLIGSSSSANQGLSNVYFFELPTLLPDQIVTDANFDFNLSSIDGGSPLFNADLYGLGYVSSPPALDASWYAEVSDSRTRASLGTGSSGTVSLLDDDILTSSSVAGAIASAENDSIAAFLNSLYEDGASGGDFAAFQFIADQVVSGPSPNGIGYRISHADAGNLANLEITAATVPEPASLLIWACLGSAGFFLGRRRLTQRRAATVANPQV